MTTPESAPDQPAQPTPPQPGGAQPTGWGEPPRYGQYAPGYDPSAPQPTPQQPSAPPQGGPQYGAPQYGAPQYGGPQYGGPQYGTPEGGPAASGQYGQSQYGQYTPGGAPQGYRPPADKPGIVPLRPLTLGELYDGAFGAVRHNPGVTLGLTSIVVVAAVVLGTLVSIPITTWFTDLLGGAMTQLDSDPAMQDLAGMESLLGVTYGSVLGTSLLVALATPLAMGIMAISVSDSVIGRKISVAEAWRRIGKRWWFLIGFALLSGLVVLVVYALAIGIVIGLFAIDPTLGAISIFLLLAGLAVAAVWAFTRVLLIPPALAVEGGSFWTTCARAWKLTRGTFWRLLGIYLLTSLILGVIGQVVAFPIGIVLSLFAMTANDVGLAISYGVTYAVTGAISVLFGGGVTALLYIDTRMRREGLDVQLQAAAAAVTDK